jgi:hypothetical protein
MNARLVSLSGRGWPVLGECVALVRLRDCPGFAVGVQDGFRSGGVGRVWLHLRPARRRAAYLAALHQLPIVESI